MRPPIITLTTDFGTAGPYVAAMKGVILGINPAVQLVDVSHEIAPQNIREAALCLAQVVPCFPPGTIHVVVVDPGVGSDRRLLGAQARGQLFLAPDNGVLSWAVRGTLQGGPTAEDAEGRREENSVIELTEKRFWRESVAATFHGRDILAPVAAHLSLGVSPAQLGRPVSEYVQLPWPAATRNGIALVGEVLAVDRFGNLITNIRASDLGDWQFVVPALAGPDLSTCPEGRSLPKEKRLAEKSASNRGGGPVPVFCRRITIAGRELPLLRTYSDALPGDALALIGSSGLLEIAVRDGSAAQGMCCGVGTAVQVNNVKDTRSAAKTA